MHSADETIDVSFLVYTKSVSFDYQWVYGLNDKKIQHELQTHLLDWIGTNRLAELPTITTFFRLRDYFALMVAQESRTRVDKERRPIFQRALFIWQYTDGLCYHHLEPLSLLLREEAERVYAELPNDTVRLETQTRDLKLNLAVLDKGSIELTDDYWDLPHGLAWQDIMRENLTVEVPSVWDFRKMVAGLVDESISPPCMLYIGNFLPVEHRKPSDESWLVSARDATQSVQPRILDAEGRPVSLDDLSRLRQRGGAYAGRVSTGAPLPPEHGLTPIPAREEKRSRNGPRQDSHPVGRSETPPDSRAVDSAAVEEYFGQYSEPDLYFNKTKRSELVRLLNKVLARDRSPLAQAETRLLMLLTPAALVSYQDGNYSDVVVSWNNLLNEILVFYHQTSKGMPQEWGRRLDSLYEITTQNLAEPQKGWVEQFGDACHTLRKLLENL